MKDHIKEMFEKHGIKDTPQAYRIYGLAYEHGHSAGYSEVELYFDEFVTIITDFDANGDPR